jgi:phage shock protein A
MSDFNALVEAEIDRHARQWEKTEERLHAEIGKLTDKVAELQTKLKHPSAQNTLNQVRAVISDFFDSEEPRHMLHTLEEIRAIVQVQP